MQHTGTRSRHPASFRDPAGCVFEEGGVLYRRVDACYRRQFDMLMTSGLYDDLTARGLLIPHADASPEQACGDGAYKVLRPRRIPFLSYPYEWCFSQLKDAALATLAIQEAAIDRGMTLKDASAYNIQFDGGKPVLIDTLSFEAWDPTRPWAAYRQFCQHFLAPLAVMAWTSPHLQRLPELWDDGIPLDLAARLLPLWSKGKPGILFHLVLHARFQRRYAGRADAVPRQDGRAGERGMRGLIDHLRRTVSSIAWAPEGTEWADYYRNLHYAEDALAHKRETVDAWTDALRPSIAWDIGANAGMFSEGLRQRARLVLALDCDPAAVERLYLAERKREGSPILPLIVDVARPSADCGWAHREHASLERRGPADLVLALAVIHHLAISRGIPFDELAAYFARIARALIVEFVPPDDAQARRLLARRPHAAAACTAQAFEDSFRRHFALRERVPLRSSSRVLYRMERLSS